MCKFQKAKTVVKGRKKQILSTHVLSFYSQQWKQKVPNQRVKGVPNIYSASKLTQPNYEPVRKGRYMCYVLISSPQSYAEQRSDGMTSENFLLSSDRSTLSELSTCM